MYDIDKDRAAEIILDHKIKCRSSKTEEKLSCNQCNFKAGNSNEHEDHMKNCHVEIKSPDSKKSKVASDEEETLQRMQSLSVSEKNLPDLEENVVNGEMEIDADRKRKREEVVKEKSFKENHDERSTVEITKTNYKNYPNIRNLPKQVQNIVSSGSKEAVVPGNGTCLIGTTAVHIEGDTENTKQLAMNLNTHIAMYRHKYLPKIEADFPLTVTIGVSGETKIFSKGQEQDFFDWLMSAPGAVYMWRGCMDIIALSNMLRMDIDCIVHEEGSVPEGYHFSPDPEFPFID